MKPVTVNRDRLLETLRLNRDVHRKTFLESFAGYRDALVTFFEEEVRRVRLFVEEPVTEPYVIDAVPVPPIEYTKYYERAISLIEWSLGEEIVLDVRDFDRYVLNEWEWSPAFEGTKARYTG